MDPEDTPAPNGTTPPHAPEATGTEQRAGCDARDLQSGMRDMYWLRKPISHRALDEATPISTTAAAMDPQFSDSLRELIFGGRTATVDDPEFEQTLDLSREHHFVAVNCCNGLRSRALMAVVSFDKRNGVLTPRRHYDRVCRLTDAATASYLRVHYAHSLDCRLSPGAVLQSTDRFCRQARGPAFVPAKLDELGWCDVTRGAASTQPKSIGPVRRDDGRRANQPFARGRERGILMALLERAHLTTIGRASSFAGEVDRVEQALQLSRSTKTPLIAGPMGNWIVCPTDLDHDSRTLLEALRTVAPRDSIVHCWVLVVLDHVGEPSGKTRRVTTLARDGAKHLIDLPTSVAVWSGDAGVARAPYAGCLRVVLTIEGELRVVSGYVHPIMAVHKWCPVESHQERILLAALPAQIPVSLASRRLRVSKVEFSIACGDDRFLLDAVVEEQDAAGVWRVVALIEVLGSTAIDYLDTKWRDRPLIEAFTPVIYLAPRRLKGAIRRIHPFPLRSFAVQLDEIADHGLFNENVARAVLPWRKVR